MVSKKECYLYEVKDKNYVRCNACSHRCLIKKGDVGICGVRENINGKLYLKVYERPVSLNIDPIEKKPLYHFYPGKEILSFGTVGCNFKCAFCQNWDISQISRKDFSKEFGVERQISGHKKKVEDIVNMAIKENIPMIAYTYNEPAVFFEFAYDTAKLANKKGLKNVYVSNGYETKESLDMIKEYLDAINIDLKSFSGEFYNRICGAKLSRVLETIKYVYKLGIWMEITTLLIPGYNDSDDEIRKIAKFIKSLSDSIPWHISRFYPSFKMNDVLPTPLERMERAYEIGREVGLKYIYLGNIGDTDKVNTCCPECGKEIIHREFMGNIESRVKNNKCPYCGGYVHGVFE